VAVRLFILVLNSRRTVVEYNDTNHEVTVEVRDRFNNPDASTEVDAGPGSDVNLAVAFPDTLSSVERTRARLTLIERLSVALGTDDVDVVPSIRRPRHCWRRYSAMGSYFGNSARQAFSTPVRLAGWQGCGIQKRPLTPVRRCDR